MHALYPLEIGDQVLGDQMVTILWPRLLKFDSDHLSLNLCLFIILLSLNDALLGKLFVAMFITLEHYLG